MEILYTLDIKTIHIVVVLFAFFAWSCLVWSVGAYIQDNGTNAWPLVVVIPMMANIVVFVIFLYRLIAELW